MMTELYKLKTVLLSAESAKSKVQRSKIKDQRFLIVVFNLILFVQLLNLLSHTARQRVLVADRGHEARQRLA